MRNLKKSLRTGILTFIIAILVTLFSTGITEFVPLAAAVIILLTVVLVGIVFDLLGVAVTAADPAPLNAKAAKKVFGAKKALFLIKHADEVASFCCDIVGDICGTISGALGAVVVLRMSRGFDLSQSILEIFVLALVAALTVGGKAFGKSIAIHRSNDITFYMGKFIASFDIVSKVGSNASKNDGRGDDRWLSWRKLTTRKNSKS